MSLVVFVFLFDFAVVKLMIAALTCCCGNIQSVTENFAEAHCYCVLDGCTDGTTVCFIMTQSDP